MSEFRDFLNEQLQDPEVKKEYDALEAEYSIKQAIIDARNTVNMSQQELSQRTGIAQSDISKLENGNANPSIKTLRRLAEGLGMKLKITFEPISSSHIAYK